jgi:DNA-directed RNA polymerase subunit alpha
MLASITPAEIKIERVDSEDDRYGRYVIEPLESGYGTTLGNALRRVLLSSLPGAAVTAIRIDGVYHEFSTIKHVKEDITQIILNVKQIRLRSKEDSAVRISVEASGEGLLTAGDINLPTGVEIVNPEQPLLTMDSPEARISMELTVQRGKGYQTAESQEGLPIGTIPIDATFSPVRRVNFFSEPTRRGHLTNLDRLTIEIWTDGTINPDTALSDSARILAERFELIATWGRVQLPELPPGQIPIGGLVPISPAVREMPIEDLALSARTYNALRRFGVTKGGQILGKTEDELLDIPKFGKKSLQELLDKLAAKGIIPAPPEEEAEEEAEPGEAEEEAEEEAEPGEAEEEAEEEAEPGAPEEEKATEVAQETAAELPSNKASGSKGRKR